MMQKNVEEDEYDEYGLRKEKWELYKPKKYYLHPENEYALQKHLKEIEDKMKSYKYSEDVPRLLFRRLRQSRGVELYEDAIWFWSIHGFLLGKLYGKVLHGDLMSKRQSRAATLKCILVVNLIAAAHVWFAPQNQPQNRGIYEQLPFETRLKNHLDYNYDLYRNIEKLKYTDKYMSKHEYYRTIREHYRKKQDLRIKLQKEYGI